MDLKCSAADISGLEGSIPGLCEDEGQPLKWKQVGALIPIYNCLCQAETQRQPMGLQKLYKG